MWRAGLFGAAALAMFISSASAQAPSEPASTQAAAKPLSLFGAADMLKAAGDLRFAAEAFERFGGTLEGIVASISTALAETSRNHAEMSDNFDPFGYKAAFQTIQEQNKTIERLQRAEIRRLKRELRVAKHTGQTSRKQMKNRRGPMAK